METPSSVRLHSEIVFSIKPFTFFFILIIEYVVALYKWVNIFDNIAISDVALGQMPCLLHNGVLIYCTAIESSVSLTAAGVFRIAMQTWSKS